MIAGSSDVFLDVPIFFHPLLGYTCTVTVEGNNGFAVLLKLVALNLWA